MNKLQIEVNKNNEPTVSGRVLHDFLEVKTRYNDWFTRMMEYGFVENKDFKAITQKRVTAQGNETTFVDHQLTIDMAKHLAMIQRNEKGMIARNYFIEVENKWNSPEMVMSRALTIANNNLLMKDEQIQKLQIENDTMKPKAEYFDTLVDKNMVINIRDTAKALGEKQNTFVKWLLGKKFVYRDSGKRLKAYAKFVENNDNSNVNGYFRYKTNKNDKSPWAGVQLMITPKGMSAFKLLLGKVSFEL